MEYESSTRELSDLSRQALNFFIPAVGGFATAKFGFGPFSDHPVLYSFVAGLTGYALLITGVMDSIGDLLWPLRDNYSGDFHNSLIAKLQE